MAEIVFSIVATSILIGGLSIIISRAIIKTRIAKYVKNCDNDTCCTVKELNCTIIKLEGEKKVAIKYGCDALDDRNEALIMLSNKLSDDIRNH